MHQEENQRSRRREIKTFKSQVNVPDRQKKDKSENHSRIRYHQRVFAATIEKILHEVKRSDQCILKKKRLNHQSFHLLQTNIFIEMQENRARKS